MRPLEKVLDPGPASAPMANLRPGGVLAEPPFDSAENKLYPSADNPRIIETERKARHWQMKPVDVANPNL
jgi:hypothetical protein